MTATVLLQPRDPRPDDRRPVDGVRAPRLSFAPAGHVPARLDGAWWPYSRDLTGELRSLVPELDERWGRITRVAVNPTYWPEIPHKIRLNGHVLHVGWFLEEQDRHQLMLLSFQVGRWDLLVVPPRTPPDAAAWLMAAAADPLRRSTASELVAEAADRADAPAARTADRPAHDAGARPDRAADGAAPDSG
ncbi:DUF5994 family protein [Actinacidiphila sp. ITFR-21]|uniref:DUF5994 family protein n=1 Tax=Actinacidiphila sp. ITFR-21 TaxID=3075199 RepID=UPI0028895E2A|nr:DUF5994 family protein [Streptomyces sp. ITFR-21]WNI16447.1 DUF5994 family protein [Streptomyces sp. ITFR-21]